MSVVSVLPVVTPLRDEELALAASQAHKEGKSPLEILERNDSRSDSELVAALGHAFCYPVVTEEELDACEPEFDLLSTTEAGKRNCVIAQRSGERIIIISDPFDTTLRPWIESRVGTTCSYVLASRAHLKSYIVRHESSMRAMDSAYEGTETQQDENGQIESLTIASISEDSSPVVKLVHSTLFDALRAGASDVHLESLPHGMLVRYRVDGVLSTVADISGSETAEQAISRIKVMSDLDIAERRIPQDGRFKVAIDGRAIDFRVSIMPSVLGEDAVLRILDKQAITDQMEGLQLMGLGFDEEMADQLRMLSSLPHGMLLVTGPTGSGKTTTLYAAISETSTGTEKIVTIEDPVEYQLPGVLQIPVNEKKGLTFAKGLRSILRHDPDKIMVGEIRDPETVQIAVQSALTGHLVFTTVHANSVFDVLSRFLHMGADPYSFVSALNGILAQRLLRLLCEHCAVETPSSEVHRLGSRQPRGCTLCRGTGYRGRRAIGELLILDDELREGIIERHPVRKLKEIARQNGMRFIRDIAIDMVERGETTLEEVNRVTSAI